MKTTIVIADPLFARAKRLAQRTGRPLRGLVEEGLRMVIEAEEQRSAYRLRDFSVGRQGAPNPLEALSWPELRDQVYGGGDG